LKIAGFRGRSKNLRAKLIEFDHPADRQHARLRHERQQCAFLGIARRPHEQNLESPP
jgi:hypothetical protein